MINIYKIMSIKIVVGCQWGDEGKGKLVDILANKNDIVARYNGGNNAGHTIKQNDNIYKLHLVPSGIIYGKQCIIGNGCVIHIPSLLEEINELEKEGINCSNKIFISDRAHLVFDHYITIDKINETSNNKIGTTCKGIGPTYSSKFSRIGLRVCDLYEEDFEKKFINHCEKLQNLYPSLNIKIKDEYNKYKKLSKKIKSMVINSVYFMNNAIKNKNNILLEGANAAMLDIDFGTYPYVTSSNPTTGGACTGLGISPKSIGNIYGVVKAYTTRVGLGPFPTETIDNVGNYLQTKGFEFGTTTGRKRRCGWLDIPMLQYTLLINGITEICLTKLDVLSGLKTIKICDKYILLDKIYENGDYPASLETLEKITPHYIELNGWDDDISNIHEFDKLPINTQIYVKKIEELLNIPITFIGIGPDRNAIITK